MILMNLWLLLRVVPIMPSARLAISAVRVYDHSALVIELLIAALLLVFQALQQHVQLVQHLLGHAHALGRIPALV